MVKKHWDREEGESSVPSKEGRGTQRQLMVARWNIGSGSPDLPKFFREPGTSGFLRVLP